MEKDKKIVLPGGAGLVGQNLVAFLKEAGYSNIVVIDKHKKNLDILKSLHKDVVAVYGDLSEEGDWERSIEGADVVVMLQAQIGAKTYEPFYKNTIKSTENVLKACKKYNIEYIVHISSSVVNSVADDFYTQTKKDQEKMVLESGIKNVVLRPTLMFGWFDRKHLGWLSRFMKRVPIFPIPGDGKYIRQPLYVKDFCNIIIDCIQTRKEGIYDITGIEKVYYTDIIKAIKKYTKSKTLILNIPYWLFYTLLYIWGIFDPDPPFTVDQLKALVAGDIFEVIDWPNIFNVKPTPFGKAIEETFTHPIYSKVVLEF
ncbi:NAD-dependent epimerase/dehydratase [Hydrogenobaculum sp. Y04AAS1]|uniref:NAD-dependent epimerase/dehydratase family protein n=1 Tax=Hydrogenobaculum sp. (strain Y04AAS1) TaxID=380749 RepID=UPI00015BD287|nr:NAD-dependent epimerase/dehydratase [Hydrogenobaculum sp. Y04AAS1]HCT66896.1 NAD-dependent dehydratase [Hydrogenobaculum sp.]